LAYFTIEGYNSYSGCDITVTASLPSINGQPMNKYYTLGSLQTLSISTHQDKRPVRSLGIINAKDYVMGPRTIAGSMVFAVFNKHFATEIMHDLGASGSNVVLPDEIPALNITVNFANEYGRMSRMAIYGVKIVNEGQVMSINDLYTENTYQFVALGLEPLNVNIGECEGSSSQASSDSIKYEDPLKVNPSLVSNPEVLKTTRQDLSRLMNYGYVGNDVVVKDITNSTDALLDNKVFLENAGANLVEQIQNNPKIDKDIIEEINTPNSYKSIVLSVMVDQPTSVNDLGLAVFTLTPEQTQGTIYIYPPDSNTPDKEYTISVRERKSLVISLPPGKYQAQYISPNGETSNTVRFVIEKYIESKIIDHQLLYPIIDKVTNDSITVSSPEPTHNTVVYFIDGASPTTVPLGKKSVRIGNLQPNTEYKIYTTNDASSSGYRSQIITVKTYSRENEEVLMLQEFLKTNNNMLLTTTPSDNMFDDYDFSNYNTLIDMVLDMPESHEKQELMIYATELTNHLNTSHNIDNTMHIYNDIQVHPFSSIIKVDGYEIMYVYNNNNFKSTLNKNLNATNDSFCATPNKHYTVFGVTNSNAKSVKQHFTVCKNSSYLELERYCETEQYKKLDISDYLTQYATYKYETVESLLIKDNFHSDINILEIPYVYKEDNEVYADINYTTLDRSSTYYLCCSELYSALDYSPARKIPFTTETITNRLRLKDYYLGIVPNKKYLFWIEDFNFIKISKPYLYTDNSTSIHNELRTVYKKELYSKLLSLKKDVLKAYGNKTVITDLFDYIYSLEPSQKDFYSVFISELINTLDTSYYVSNIIDPLFEILKVIHNQADINNLPDIQINKKTRTIIFDNLNNYYICAKNYYDSEETRLLELDNTITYGKEGITIIYLINHNMIYKSGFILIDNFNNTIKYTLDLENHIKEVGDL
jgi:hypothetical protein